MGEWDSGEVRLNFMVILGRSLGEVVAWAFGANTPDHTTLEGTVGQNQVVVRHLIIHFPTNLGVSE